MPVRRIFAIVALLFTVVVSAVHADIGATTYVKRFAGYDGCFLLYDANKGQLLLEHNPVNRCRERIPANSTFKIPLSLMAYDLGLIKESTVFKWDGKVSDELPDWNKDQTPATWQH